MRRWVRVAAGAVFVLALAFFVLVTEFDYHGHNEGIFLLKGAHGTLFELTDDLFLGDELNLIYSIDFKKPESHYYKAACQHQPGKAYLCYSWDPKEGDGFVRNFMPDGKQLLTCLSRFKDSGGKDVHGLFIGGGLPSVLASERGAILSETGMAYYDGKVWRHLWCNINEGITSAATLKNYYPSEWKYLGSKILNESNETLVIRSSHEFEIDGTRLHVDRYAYFRAGLTCMVLTNKVVNLGAREVSYYYCFGDEPWVGQFGSSAGNVGWVKDHLIQTVQFVDSKKYRYAGFFDYGNDLIGEGHNFTKVANFIQWIGYPKPVVFFSNGTNEYPTDKNKGTPLKSNERFIGVQWGPYVIKPGETQHYVLAVGMAGNDPKTGFPVKPGLSDMRY